MKKMKLFLVAGTALLLVSKNAKSQDVTYQYPASSTAAIQLPQPFTVTFLDEDEEYLRFRITITVSEKTDAALSVNVKNVGQIYAASFNDSYREQILKIAKQHNQILDFKLSIGDNVYSKTFNTKTYKTENIVAAKF